jgi:GNAT superfamily N-acetyltransferase
MEATNSPHQIIKAISDEQILATSAVMRELRPNIPTDQYLATVQRMMQTDGYHLAALVVDGTVRAVAGYRFMEMLYCGKIMYVDDLNTDPHFRSNGYGAALMDWLKNEASAHDCGQLHLDSGVQRENTHRFYFREGLTINCYHFRVALPK